MSRSMILTLTRTSGYLHGTPRPRLVLRDLVYGTIGLICELVVRVSTEPRRGRSSSSRGSCLSLSLPKRWTFNAFDSLIALEVIDE
jgi:hypothetical protein